MFLLLACIFCFSTILNPRSYFISAAPSCRCVASNSTCWPTTTAWQTFNASINGRLLQPKPSASVCNGGNYDANACNTAKIQWWNSTWRSDLVGAMQNHNWENSSCSTTINSTKCNQGSVPVIAVNATLPEHVQATLRFAAANNLRLVIKSTGHDYLGRSGAAGSILLWLHYMRNLTLIPLYSSCSQSNIPNVVRITAGVQWGEVYRWLDQYNLTVVGGASGTVAAVGGYLQGGGHGPLSRFKGMAADQVLEYDVVLANGQRQTVSPCQNGDLFWALSGGGAGTYAVVLSAILRTFPTPTMATATYDLTAPNEVRYSTLIRSCIRLLVTLSDIGCSGYFSIVDKKISGIFHIPNGDLNVLNSTLSQFAADNRDIDFSRSNFFTFPSLYSYFAAVLANGNPTGFNVQLSSRLIPESVVRNNPDKVADVFVEARGYSDMGSGLLGHLVAGGQVANTSIANNSVNPGWRTALLHMVNTQAWLDTTPDTDREYVIKDLARRAEILNKLLTNTSSTCYLNEADPNEPNWQEKFFGSRANYDRLRSVKRTVDPNDLFICKNCVGSDDWTDDLNCPKASAPSMFIPTVYFFIITIFLLFA